MFIDASTSANSDVRKKVVVSQNSTSDYCLKMLDRLLKLIITIQFKYIVLAVGPPVLMYGSESYTPTVWNI